jgi:hypothetical protein
MEQDSLRSGHHCALCRDPHKAAPTSSKWDLRDLWPPIVCLILSAASRDLLNPLPPLGRRVEGIPEKLCFVDDLAVAELHNTDRVCQSPWRVIVYSVMTSKEYDAGELWSSQQVRATRRRQRRDYEPPRRAGDRKDQRFAARAPERRSRRGSSRSRSLCPNGESPRPRLRRPPVRLVVISRTRIARR